MGLYTFLYENLLYRLYIIHIQPARIVTARLSRYTAHTAYTAIQPYTPYIIQRYTASLRIFYNDQRRHRDRTASVLIGSRCRWQSRGKHIQIQIESLHTRLDETDEMTNTASLYSRTF